MKDFLLLAFIILLLDLLWLNFVVKESWKNNVRNVQKSELDVKVHYAIICYIFIILGVYIFADNLYKSFMFGFIVYAIFNLTNLAIFKNYSLKTAIIDTFWGGFLVLGSVFIVSKNKFQHNDILQ
jgi:uncharacterized membrane protein